MTLEIVNVTKTFPGFTLGPINLRLDDDMILVLIGPNGSGKSTLLNLIIGLIKPDTGSIYVDGKEITKLPIESRKMGYSFQNPSLFPHMSVYENIVFGIKKSDRKSMELQIKKLTESFGLSHLLERNIYGLSGGEKQKVSLGRMLITKPKIMLMDEPLTHLDSITKSKLRKDLRRILKKERVLGIYVTHFEDDVYALADHVSVLRNGLIERTDTLKSHLSYLNNDSPIFSSMPEIFQDYYNYLEGHVIESKHMVTTFKVGVHEFKTLGNYPINSTVGVLIKPEDIILSSDLVKTSARNIIKAKVIRFDTNAYLKTGALDIHLSIDDIHMVSRITVESKNHLGISEGEYVYALFKATAPRVVREEK